MLTTGTPRYEHSRIPTLEFPTKHRLWRNKLTDRPGSSIGARVDVRPEPERRHSRVAHRMQRFESVLPRPSVLRRDRMLQHDDVSLRKIERRSDAAILLVRVR